MQQALVITIKSLGTRHPNSETVLGNYNMLLQKLGLTDNEIQVSIRKLLEFFLATPLLGISPPLVDPLQTIVLQSQSLELPLHDRAL